MMAKENFFYPNEEIVALVQMLDRPQDKGLFSKDVLIEYPHLAEEYTRVCPRRFDLATAAQKAASGAYSSDARLTALREDIELMVNNCYRFNGVKGPLAVIASNFHKFAQEQIDAYVTGKAGGRRLSSLRFATTVSEMTRGKRGREEMQQHQQQVKGARNNASGSGSGGPTNADIVKLVDSLNRREDKRAFAVDVAEAYPELKQAYDEVCPVKINLIIVRERAKEGYYLGVPQQEQRRSLRQTQQSLNEASQSQAVFADTVADSLQLLRDDVELMVSNCIRFNASVQEWVQLAQSFQVYAHKKIDDFVLRHAPHLNGTMLGVEKYAATGQQQQQQQQQTSLRSQQTGLESRNGNNSSNNNTNNSCHDRDGEQTVVGTASPTALPLSLNGKKGALRKTPTGAAAAAAAVTVVNYVTPTVEPTALQPVFTTPVALRTRLISDHLHRETLRARLISTLVEDGIMEDSGNLDSGSDTPADNSFFPRMFSRALSCRAVLSAFVVSLQNFYRLQRERHDFADPFEYPRQEEQLYIDCITLIEQQFERLFFHMLLYEQEKADVYYWSATRAARRVVDCGGSSLPSNEKNDVFFSGCCCWLDGVHLCYLVRFLQHFPQLMGLACATIVKSDVKETEKGRPVLHITQVAKGVIEKFAKITEELLTFIAAYEQKIVDDGKRVEL